MPTDLPIVLTIDDLTPILERLDALEAASGPVGGPFWWHENSGSSSELVTTIPITTGSPYTRKVIFSIALPDLAAGDLIEAKASMQVTTSYNYNCMIGSLLILTDSATSTSGLVADISEAAGENFDMAVHHKKVADFGSYRVTTPLIGKYVNFIAYAASTGALPGHALTVDLDYGRLIVDVIRAAALEN